MLRAASCLLNNAKCRKVGCVPNRALVKTFVNIETLDLVGLTEDAIRQSIDYTHGILDIIDETLLANGAFRLAAMMELANLSTFVGNLLGSGIANTSNGVFKRNIPHKYPDLLS